MIDTDDGHRHLALSEYAYDVDINRILRKYGVSAGTLNRETLRTSGMPILDSAALTKLDTLVKRAQSNDATPGLSPCTPRTPGANQTPPGSRLGKGLA